MKRFVVIVLAAAVILGGDWPDLGLDPGRTRVSPEPIGPTLSPAWSKNVASRIIATPVSSDGIVVIGTQDGRVIGVRETDGATLWTFTAATEIMSTPAIRAGRVYAASRDGSLFSLRLADGVLLWSAALGGAAYSSPAFVNGALVIGIGAPRAAVRAVDPATGATIWETPAEDSVYSSAAVDGSTLWVGSTRGRYDQLDAATGAPFSTVSTNGLVALSSPLVAFGQTIVVPGGTDMTMRALGAWAVPLTDPTPPGFGTINGIRLDASSPVVVGPLVCAVVRFDYFIDTNADFIDDTFMVQEYAVGIDPSIPAVVWQAPLGSISSASRNIIPTLGMSPTPVSIDAGTRVVVGSSVEATLRILNGATGAPTFSTLLDDPGRSSPIVSNGRVLWGTDGGTLWSLQGVANGAPAPPLTGFNPPNGFFSSMDVGTLSWDPATDPNDPVAALTYVVRIDTDGEILEDFAQEIVTAPGVTSASLAPPASPTAAYTYAVRTIDPAGARSAWSAPQTFTVSNAPAPPSGLTATPSISAVVLSWTASPTAGVVGYNVRWTGGGPIFTVATSQIVTGLVNGVTYTFDVRAVDGDGDESTPVTAQATPTDVGIVTVNGFPFGSLIAAMGAAPPGSTIRVGRGTFVVPPAMTLVGMSLIGISPHETWLDASGLGTAITVMADGANTPMLLAHFSLFGATVGIDAQSGVVTMTHLIVREMTDAGVRISGPAIADLVNNTILLNGGPSIDAINGTSIIRNNILVRSGTGLRVVPPAMETHTFNSVWGNGFDYAGTGPGTGDIPMGPTFVDEAARDFRESPGAPTIDSGDPSDAFSLEPEPDGDRINIGAYGNTPWAATMYSPNPAGTGRGGDNSCFSMSAGSRKASVLWTITMIFALLVLARGRR